MTEPHGLTRFALSADEEFKVVLGSAENCHLRADHLAAIHDNLMSLGDKNWQVKALVQSMIRSGSCLLIQHFHRGYLPYREPSPMGLQRAISVAGGALAARYLEMRDTTPNENLLSCVRTIDEFGCSFIIWRQLHNEIVRSEGGGPVESPGLLSALALGLWQIELPVIPTEEANLTGLLGPLVPSISALTDWGDIYESEVDFMEILVKDFVPRLAYLLGNRTS